MKRKHKHQHAGGEVTELARETAKVEQYWIVGDRPEPRIPPKNYNYVEELIDLQIELIKLQEYVRHNRLKMCVIFEGRDAAGKGGVIRRITDPLNPRVCRVVALATPTERERGQWYFQRYVAELPSAGEFCSTGAGTTAPALSASWASAQRTNIRSSCDRAPSPKKCWFARVSSS
jgi:polyphosphate kinase 2 (PPK2 family)